MTISYTTGTVSVTAGSDIVTGTGTAWVIANISPGSFGLDSANGNPIPVAEIISNTSMRLVTPWRGTSVSGSAYWLSYDTRDGQQTVNNAQRLAEYIARLDNDALKAIAALTPGDELVPVFSGPDSAVLVPRSDFGSGGSGGGVDVNAQVSTLSDRAQYNSEVAGFRVLVSNVGDGRAAVYTKNSITSGDWSDPAYFTGPSGAPGNDGDPGDPGPYTTIVVGDVTTLPPGSQATVDFRQIGTDTVALDIGLPAGQDGTGAGTVTSVDVSVPTGFSVAGGPVTSSGIITISFASGYRAYTDVESAKLSGIATGAQVNTVMSVAGRTGEVVIASSDVSGLGNAATRNVGSASGTVAAGDDSRLENNAKLNVEDQTLTGGARVTSKDLGTVTTGTLTLDPGDRPLQHYTNNGAHTLAPGSNTGSFLLDITNGASSGVITLTGWTKIVGDAFTTTSGQKFRLHCSIGAGGSLVVVQGMQ